MLHCKVSFHIQRSGSTSMFYSCDLQIPVNIKNACTVKNRSYVFVTTRTYT